MIWTCSVAAANLAAKAFPLQPLSLKLLTPQPLLFGALGSQLCLSPHLLPDRPPQDTIVNSVYMGMETTTTLSSPK